MLTWGVPRSSRMDDLDALVASLPSDSGGGPVHPLLAALQQASPAPDLMPGVSPSASPPAPSGPKITNGSMSGWAPLSDPSEQSGDLSASLTAPPIGIQGTVTPLTAVPTDALKRHGPDWRGIARNVGDAATMMLALRGNPGAAQMLQTQAAGKRYAQEDAIQRAKMGLDLQRWMAEYGLKADEARRAAEKAKQPIIHDANGNVLAIAPDGSSVRTLVEGRTDAQDYADSLGLPEGSAEYNSALKDYQLGAHGPTGFSQATALERMRNAVQIGNNIRNNTTSAANSVRSTTQSNTNNLRSTSTSATNNQRSTATTAGSFSYQHGSGRQRGRMGAAPVAQDAHGNKITWNGSAWVPAH